MGTLLKLACSSRLEPLVDALAARLRDEPLADPMVLERVAVPSRGSERWLSQQLAERLGGSDRGVPGPDGVCAGIDFPFPGAVIEEVVAATEDDGGDRAAAWSPDRLVWPILEILDELRRGTRDGDGALAPLRSHLLGPDGMVASRRWQLARRVADTFDRYTLLRPRMVELWERGVDAHPRVEIDPPPAEAPAPHLDAAQRWQPHLWRELHQRLGATSSPARLRHADATLRRAAAPRLGGSSDDARVAARLTPRLPGRLSVFGVTALPPAHLRLLEALGALTDVTVYLLVASPAQWAQDGGTAPASRHPLLSSLGTVGAGMAWAARQVDVERTWLDDHDGAGRKDGAPAPTTNLARVQRDIIADRRPEDAGPVPADRTVQVHGCHGPSRQVEVLREVITGLLADDPTLEPRDVLVMTPDLDTFAPLVSAVFDHEPSHRADRPPSLPARIADRRLDAHNEVAAAALGLLDLVDSRVTASTVLDVLACPPVQARFRLDARDLDALTGWVRHTGIHWGIDGDHRAAHGQPGEDHHTWQAGLDRLRAGAAMADEDDRCVGGVVPYDDVEGDDVDRLGRVSRALQTLFTHVRALVAPRPIDGWHDALIAAVDDLTAVDRARVWQRQQVRAVLDGLVDASAAADTDGKPSAVELTLPEVRGELRSKLGRQPAAARYASGAITVCELAPLRAVPHRVVCLLGLDDGAFPRTPTPLGFDLVAADPQPADRDPRAEDRQLLLDAVLAARGHLVATYTRRDPRTNAEQPPSAPLGEVIETLARTRGLAGDDLDAVVIDHPLQPFHWRYFVDDAHHRQAQGASDPGPQVALPRSFDPQLLAAARAHVGESQPVTGFVDDPLPEPDGADPWSRIDLVALEDFFANPIRRLLRYRLEMATSLREGGVEDRDRFELDSLERWGVIREQLARWCAGDDLDDWRFTARGRGALPPGTPGGYVLDDVDAEVTAICAALAQEVGAAGPPAWRAVTVDADLVVDGRPVSVVGTVHDRVDDRLVLVQASKVDARASMRAWLRLLAVVASGADVAEAVVVGRGGRAEAKTLTVSLADTGDPPAFARERLGELAAVFERGHREALPLLPRTTAAFVRGGGDAGQVPKKARDAWEGNAKVPGEGADEAVVMALGADAELADVLDETLVSCARTIWDPLLARGGEP